GGSAAWWARRKGRSFVVARTNPPALGGPPGPGSFLLQDRPARPRDIGRLRRLVGSPEGSILRRRSHEPSGPRGASGSGLVPPAGPTRSPTRHRAAPPPGGLAGRVDPSSLAR